MGDDTTAAEPPGAAGPVWFAGDLGDPWVVAIADALAAGLPLPVERVSCPGPLADGTLPVDPSAPPACLVLHRATLTRTDAERLARLRSLRHPPTRVVLCVGPHVRHAELERWAALFDAVVPEATAAAQVARLAAGTGHDAIAPPMAAPRVPVAIVSTNGSMRAMLVEAAGALGHETIEARDWDDAPARGPAVWDVPVLEPGWAETLAREAAARPVAVLLGFADRALVTRARDHGALACLDLPFDLADLAAALRRLTMTAESQPTTTPAPGRRNEPGHATPPPPTRRRPREARTREGGSTA